MVTELRYFGLRKLDDRTHNLMNQRLMTILLTALLIATAAAFAVYRYAGAALGARIQGQATPILVATHDIQLGAVIHAGDVKLGQWIGPLPQNAIAKIEPALGRGVITALYDGEPVLESRLAPLCARQRAEWADPRTCRHRPADQETNFPEAAAVADPGNR